MYHHHGAWSMFGRYHGDKVNGDPDLVTEKLFSMNDSNIDVRGDKHEKVTA